MAFAYLGGLLANVDIAGASDFAISSTRSPNLSRARSIEASMSLPVRRALMTRSSSSTLPDVLSLFNSFIRSARDTPSGTSY
jgi:hypothetical protein